MWKLLAHSILKNRLIFLIIVFVVTLFMGYKSTGLELEYEYLSFLKKSDSTFIDYINFKKTFGEDANVLLVGIQDSNFFQVKKINDWNTLQDSIKKIDGVNQVFSLINTFRLDKDTIEKKFVTHKIFEFPVANQNVVDSIKEHLYNLPFYESLVYNKSEHVYVFAITMDKDLINSSEREQAILQLESICDAFGEKYNTEIHYSGLPYTRSRIGMLVKSEMYVFMVIAALVSAIILFMFFRSFKVVLFAMLVVCVGVIWALGTMALMGFKITVLTGMIPPLLIVIGIPNCVFLINKYHKEFASHGNKIKALHRVIEKVGNATFLTNLTTAFGFGTFISTSNKLLVEFGIVSSINILVLFVLSVAFIPIFFSFLPPPKPKHIKHLERKSINAIVEKLCFLVEFKRKWIYGITISLAIFAIVGILRLKNESFIVDDIPKTNKVYLDLKFFEKYFKGVMPVEISIDTRKPKGVMNIRVMEKMQQLQDSIIAQGPFSKPSSLVDALKFARQAFYNGSTEYYTLPDNQERNFILGYVKGEQEQKRLLNNFIDSSFRKTRISLRVADIGNVHMMDAINKLKRISDTIFPRDKYDVVLTGSSLIYAKGTSKLIYNLIQSIVLGLFLVAICMVTLFKSWKMIITALVPNLLPLLITGAIMGFVGIRLRPATILVFSVAFGIAVDSAIHLFTKYRQELLVKNQNYRDAMLKALKETGISVVYTVSILFFGFGIFILSSFGGTKALGTLISITLLIAVFCNLLILPSLIFSFNKNVTIDEFREDLADLDEPNVLIDFDQDADEVIKG